MPSLLCDAFKANPLNTQKEPDLSSMKEVPESHDWISVDDCNCNCNLKPKPKPKSKRVPVINLKGPDVVKLVGHACKKWGVFQVTNHAIPINLLDDMEAIAKELFALPIQQKLKTARPPDGISGYGVARISSFFPKLMWSEGFTIFGSPHEHARKLWPHNYNTFCDIVEEYKKEMNKLADKLMWLMLGSLGITTKDDIKWVAGQQRDQKRGCAALQLNSYPTCPDPSRAMGLAAHTDSTILTILHQNNISGLEVHKEGAGWVTVPPLSGALVIHVGDLLHILSNGLYPSVLHRAVVNRTQHRLSVAYLYGPPSNAQISPLSKLVDHDNPPLYRPVTWSEYLGTKAKHFNNALSLVRLTTVQVV